MCISSITASIHSPDLRLLDPVSGAPDDDRDTTLAPSLRDTDVPRSIKGNAVFHLSVNVSNHTGGNGPTSGRTVAPDTSMSCLIGPRTIVRP